MYKISVKHGDQEFKGQGKTAQEALQSLSRPVKIITKVFVTMTDGKRSVETMYMPARAKRLFQPVAQYLQAKYLDLLMK